MTSLEKILVTVLPQDRVTAYTAATDKTMAEEVPPAHMGVVMTLGQAMGTRHTSAALYQHLQAPSDVEGKMAPRRGRAWAANLWAEVGGVPINLISLDLDFGQKPKVNWADKLNTPEAAAFLELMGRLCEHLRCGYAFSASGARLLIMPGQRVTSLTYESYYLALLEHLHAELGVSLTGPGPHLDPACYDLGHMMRLPHVSTFAQPEDILGLPVFDLEAEPCPWTVDEDQLTALAARSSRKFEGLAARVRLTGDRPREEDIRPDWRRLRALATLDERRPDTAPSEGAYFSSWAELKDVLQTGIIGPPGDRNTRMMRTAAAVAWAPTQALGPTQLWHIMAGCVARSEPDNWAKRQTLLDELWTFCHGAALLRAEGDAERFRAQQAELAAEGAITVGRAVLCETPGAEEDEWDISAWADDPDVVAEHPAAAKLVSAAAAPVGLRIPEHTIIKIAGGYVRWHGPGLGYSKAMAGTPDLTDYRDILKDAPGAVELYELIPGKGSAPDRFKRRTLEDLGMAYTTKAYGCVHSAFTQRGEFDPETKVLRLPCWVKKGLAPIRHMEIERWMFELCGSDPLTFGNLHSWFKRACDTQDQCGALYIVGPAASGKTVLGIGLSYVWGAEPMPYSQLGLRFHPSRLLSPVIVAEEGQMSGAHRVEQEGEMFRALISQRHHMVETSKGVDATRIEGYQRVVVTANNDNALSFGGDLTKQDITAISDRISYLRVTEAAGAQASARLLALMMAEGKGDRKKGFERVVTTLLPEYILWAAENADAAPTRFGTWDSGQGDQLVSRMGQTEPLLATITQAICNNSNMTTMSDPEQPVFYHEPHRAWYVRAGLLQLHWDDIFGLGKRNPNRMSSGRRFQDGLNALCEDDTGSVKVRAGKSVFNAHRLDIARVVKYVDGGNHGGAYPADAIWRAMGGLDT